MAFFDIVIAGRIADFLFRKSAVLVIFRTRTVNFLVLLAFSVTRNVDICRYFHCFKLSVTRIVDFTRIVA